MDPTANGLLGQNLAFILNTYSFLLWGVLVMWMCAGFTMLESGSVRTKNASVICMKKHWTLLDRGNHLLLGWL